MIFTTEDFIEVYDFLKTYYRMCTNISNYVPVCPWFDDENEEEQWGFGYRDDMIIQFQQGLFNKKFYHQGQGKGDPTNTLQKRNKFWRILLVTLRVQYLIIFMIMIITMGDWTILCGAQREEDFLREQNLKSYWIYSDIYDSEIN